MSKSKLFFELMQFYYKKLQKSPKIANNYHIKYLTNKKL